MPCIGDSQRDLEACSAVGAQPMLVLTGKGQATQSENRLPPGTRVYKNLAEAVKSFLK
ncbi:D-glycero-beta-D-manno-heptose-1,7-bisphosphate 7-phosphatase [compost metagenome]